MKRLLVCAITLILCALLLLFGVSAAISATIPPYRNSIGEDNYIEKITGLYLVKQAAAQGDNLIIYGSSELRTTEISTHPANFFAGKRSGFQVNLVGRGSCQSIIHAISIAASGDSLSGQKVALITSPQSYVKEGIAPDLFMANFSQQQYLELLRDETLSTEVKQYISQRVVDIFEQYELMENASKPDMGVRYLAQHYSNPSFPTSVRNTVLTPYYLFCRYLNDLNDKVSSQILLKSMEEAPVPDLSGDINWDHELQTAVLEAEQLTANNDFGMLDSYYTTYIGTRLSRQAGMDSDLDYSVSQEYDDLRMLFEVCCQKEIEPLFIHVPLHGLWSDYTGFSLERRQQYYGNVREIAEEYGISMLDLTGFEYEEYFLCDVMHLGWKGWLEVDRALIDYYYEL